MSDVTPQFYLGSLRLDEYPFSVIREDDGVDIGSAENVMGVVETLLAEGDVMLSSHVNNRTLKVPLLVEGTDLQELAIAESILAAECDKDYNSFTLVPGDDAGPATVFRTFKAQAVHVRDDRYEAAFVRRYDLTIPAAPRAYSTDEVVIDAEVQPVDGGGTPVTPIDLLVDDCTSITGWSDPLGNFTLASSGGSVRTTTDGTGYVSMKRTGAIDMSTTPLLVVDMKITGTVTGSVVVKWNNASVTTAPAAVGASPFADCRRYYYVAPFASVTDFMVQMRLITPGRVYIPEVRRQNNPPATGTLRQKFFTADVPGSAPSQGTLEIWHATSALGMTVVHTSPATGAQGFGPALRPYLTSSGPTTTDSTLVSGGSEVISSTADVFRIPAAQVMPGTYELGAWLKCNATGTRTISYTFTLRDAAGNLLGGQVDRSVTVTFATANSWAFFSLGRIQLPTLRVPATTTSLVQLSISALSGTVEMDEAYLFDVEHGDLTLVDAGTRTRAWLTAATIDDPMPSIVVGTLEDQSDAFAAATVAAWGAHETVPGLMNVFLVTRTAVDASARLRLTPAWDNYAAS